MTRYFPHLILLLSFLLGGNLSAFSPFSLNSNAAGAENSEKLHVEASLLAEKPSISAGETVAVALVLKHEPNWHTYFSNPGSAGYAPSLDWELPNGFTAGELQFPTPSIGDLQGLVFYGYGGETWLLTYITAPKDLAGSGEVTLKAKAAWLTCDENCVPEEDELELNFTIGKTSDSDTQDAEIAEKFARARLALPTTDTGWSATAHHQGDQVTLSLTPPNENTVVPDDVRFFGLDTLEDSNVSQSTNQQDGKLILSFPLSDELEETPKRVIGIVKASDASGWGTTPVRHGWQIDVPLDDSTTGQLMNSGGPSSLLTILGLMFIGGLILNLMPCVFPVIGLKIMGFVNQAGHSRRKVIAHGLLFTLGVLISFWILASILLLGGIANWGGQLENPWVIFILLLIMLVFGLNLLGIFEIGSSASSFGGKLANRDGFTGTFFSGVLATVLATPCSAPFLGTGIGAAVALPSSQFFLAFTVMALGLSTPYLVLSLFPALVSKLPRPGAWMESFKQGMSFLLFATAGYLLWVYSGQVFDQAAEQKGLLVMLGLTLIAFALWIYGRWDLPVRAKRTRYIARVLTLLFLLAGFFLARPASGPVLEWREWSQKLQDELIAEGTPVYVDFTARWCITCQTNKVAAYTPETIREFKKKGIVMLRADKTNPNPEIDKEIRRIGRSAIPVNVLYLPSDPQPRITDTLLTADSLQGFLKTQFKE